MLQNDLLFSVRCLLLDSETKAIISYYVNFSCYLCYDNNRRFVESSLFDFHSRASKYMKIAKNLLHWQ